MRNRISSLVLVALISTLSGMPAYGSLNLTQAGIDNGFNLTLFASGFPTVNCVVCGNLVIGPFGVAVNSDGKVMVQSIADQTIKIFNDTDGQNALFPLSSVTFNEVSNASALANLAGHVYATRGDTHSVIELNNDGTFKRTVSNVGRLGLAANPIRGTLLVNDSGFNAANGAFEATGIFEVDLTNPDPNTNFRKIANGAFDGVSVSADGNTVYAASGGRVLGYTIPIPQLNTPIFDSGVNATADGTAVILGLNLFTGNVVSNNNNGTVDLINPITHTRIVLANGGTRGDFVGLDNTNGSLFLTQSSEVYRLSCGVNCSFGPPATVPEPGVAMMIPFGVAVAMVRRRHQRRLRAIDAAE